MAEIHRQATTHSPTGHCQCTITNHLQQININMPLRNEFYRIRIYVINRSGVVINHPRRLKFCLTFELRSNSQSYENKFMSWKIKYNPCKTFSSEEEKWMTAASVYQTAYSHVCLRIPEAGNILSAGSTMRMEAEFYTTLSWYNAYAFWSMLNSSLHLEVLCTPSRGLGTE